MAVSHLTGPSLSELRERREELLALFAKYRAENVRVFGSVAREEATSASDYDFLVNFDRGGSFFDLVNLELDIRELLQCDVDVLTDNSVHWFIRDRIMQEAVPL